MEETLRELRPDPGKDGIGPHLARLRRAIHRYIYGVVRIDVRRVCSMNIFFAVPLAGWQGSRGSVLSHGSPGKAFVFLPTLSSMPPARSFSDEAGVRQGL